jgi:hypothetical protein
MIVWEESAVVYRIYRNRPSTYYSNAGQGRTQNRTLKDPAKEADEV